MISELEDEIVKEFQLLEGDREMTVLYVMELGQKLENMPEEEKTEEALVKGCQSKVWLTSRLVDGKIYFYADSNTAITKGLVSLLIRTFSGQSPEAVLRHELTFMSRIGMDRFIGTQRSNGFAAMIKQMKRLALASLAKPTVNS